MQKTIWTVVCSFLILAASARASTETPEKTLLAYGPGGPHHVLQECADLFGEKHGIRVAVIKATPHELERRLREDGDIYFGGAEYMLKDFDQRNPGVLDLASAEQLHPRRIGIIVRNGNPHNIRGLDDLQREEIDLIDVKLENMRHYYNAAPGKGSNVRRFVFTGRQGVDTWLTTPEIDAWVTYKSWHVLLEEHSEFIELPGDQALRFTPIAITTRTPHRQEAMNFIDFLKSDEARKIFEEHGWD